MHVEAYLSQINFSNRPEPSPGSRPNAVLLTSDIMLVGGSLRRAATPRRTIRARCTAIFTNGLVDLGIFDTDRRAPAPGHRLHRTPALGASSRRRQPAVPITGELTADLDILVSSDADFRSAFGAARRRCDANFSGFFSDGATVGNNMCNLVKSRASTIYANPGLADLRRRLCSRRLHDERRDHDHPVSPSREPLCCSGWASRE